MMRQQPPRGIGVLYIASFAFCTAAFVTGLSFLFALHLGLETLAMWHPYAHLRYHQVVRPELILPHL